MKTKFIAIVIMAGAALAACSDNGKSEACRDSLDCWAQKFMLTADVICKEQVEKLSGPGLTWDPFRDRELLSYYQWKDKAKGTLTYQGDKAIIKTQQGDTVREQYECDIDPNNESSPLLGVRIMPRKSMD
jgi:hypothetical protein